MTDFKAGQRVLVEGTIVPSMTIQNDLKARQIVEINAVEGNEYRSRHVIVDEASIRPRRTNSMVTDTSPAEAAADAVAEYAEQHPPVEKGDWVMIEARVVGVRKDRLELRVHTGIPEHALSEGIRGRYLAISPDLISRHPHPPIPEEPNRIKLLVDVLGNVWTFGRGGNFWGSQTVDGYKERLWPDLHRDFGPMRAFSPEGDVK